MRCCSRRPAPCPASPPRRCPTWCRPRLSDFYVAYRLVVYVATPDPSQRAQAASALNASIQDLFNSYGVQIMSPGYYEDPAQPKVVPESQWYAAPAKRPDDA